MGLEQLLTTSGPNSKEVWAVRSGLQSPTSPSSTPGERKEATTLTLIQVGADIRASLVAQLVKNLPAMWETWVRSLGWEDPLEKRTATHSSILVWRILAWVQTVGRTQLSDFHFHETSETSFPGKESTCNAGDPGSIPGSRRSPGDGIDYPLQYSSAFLVEKNPPAMWETWDRSLGWKDPLEEGMATHSGILAWRIPMDRGAWRTTIHGVSKSQIQLSD